MKNLRLLNPTPSAGDTLTFAYEIVNSSGQIIQVPQGEKFAGDRMHWIERLGEDATIPAIPKIIFREGRRYAAAGYGIDELGSTIAVGAFASFVREHDTKDYPPGKYRFYVEFRRYCAKFCIRSMSSLN